MSKSILTRGQRSLLLGVLVAAGALLASSGYLFLTTPPPGASDVAQARYGDSLHGLAGVQPIPKEVGGGLRPTLPGFYQVVLLLHVVVGLALVLPAAGFIGWHLRGAWARHRPRTVWTGVAVAAVSAALVITGLFILTEANSREHRFIFRGHQLLALALPAGYLAHRLLSYAPPSRRALVGGPAAILAAIALMLGAHAATAPTPTVRPGMPEPIAAGTDPFIPFAPVNRVPGEASPFFPSQATTQTGDFMPRRTLTLEDVSREDLIAQDIEKYGFVVHDSMGSATCARCHQAIVAQWARSAHRFSSFNNPFYRASVEALRDEPDGKRRSQWCGGCHDPVLMFAGKMAGEVDPLWPEAQAGLTCLSCHAIDRLHNKAGNANYRIADEEPSPYLFADAKDGLLASVHDALVKSKPTVHKRQMLGSLHRTPELCMTCHKVSLDSPVNDYRWLRGQDEYDAWHDSGVALNASRTFYLPPTKRVCQDCHMPLVPATEGDVSAKDGMVRSHSFHTVNTALPFIRGDDETVAAAEAFLRDEKMVVDVFALRREDGAVVGALDPSAPTLAPGELVELHVVIRNKGTGHRFPGGTIDSNDAWIDLAVRDAAGETIFRSGAVDEAGDIDAGAHFYRVLFVDRESRPLFNRDPQNFHAPVYARTIGPGTADIARFRFRVPESGAGGRISVSARLLWRKFSAPFTRFTFERMRLPDLPRFEGKKVPELPITTVAEDVVTIAVAAAPAAGAAPVEVRRAEDWMRWNDYGIGNLLQGDTRAADEAFTVVGEVAAARIDGPRNRARAAVREGDLDEAFEHLERAEKIVEGDAQTAWVWGQALTKAGRLEQALRAYERVVAYFPEDRAAWQQVGRIHYLEARYEEALAAFLRVLAIDPEDRVSHYHRMLIYRALGQTENATAAREAYLKYKLDESAAEVTQRYRLAHPDDNRESQPLHVHELEAGS